jgi:hypothetical protein
MLTRYEHALFVAVCVLFAVGTFLLAWDLGGIVAAEMAT